MEYEIRSAKAGDAPEIRRIYNAAVETGGLTPEIDPLSAEGARAFVGGGDVTVCQAEGKTLAWAELRAADRGSAYRLSALLRLFTAAGPEGEAAGLALLRGMEGVALSHGYGKLLVRVMASQKPALYALRMEGFRDVGVLRAHVYYKGEREDLALLERVLPCDSAALKARFIAEDPGYKAYFAAADKPKKAPDPNKKRRVIE